MKNGKYRKAATFSLSGCPLRGEKSSSQRAFSIYTDIRKLQVKAKTSYTLSTRRLKFGYEQQWSLKVIRLRIQMIKTIIVKFV